MSSPPMRAFNLRVRCRGLRRGRFESLAAGCRWAESSCWLLFSSSCSSRRCAVFFFGSCFLMYLAVAVYSAAAASAGLGVVAAVVEEVLEGLAVAAPAAAGPAAVGSVRRMRWFLKTKL